MSPVDNSSHTLFQPLTNQPRKQRHPQVLVSRKNTPDLEERDGPAEIYLFLPPSTRHLLEMAPPPNSSPDDFRRLHDQLLAVVDPRGRNLSLLEEELGVHTEELKKLLEIPPKNEASRTKIKSGKLPAGSTRLMDGC